MKTFEKKAWRFLTKFVICLTVAILFTAVIASCDPDDTDDPANPYALWEEQSNDRIVFMSKADSPEGELYLLDKDGVITRLTNNVLHENNPAISFDGTKVVYNKGVQDSLLTWEIYILDLITGVETQLTDNGVIDAHGDWSPDGTKIVFGSFRNALGDPAGTADIYVMNNDGSVLTQLTNTSWDDNDPEWSPDGTKIVFKSTRNTQISGREEIYVMNSDGSNPQRLTTTSGFESDHDPSWGINSDHILFTRFEGSRIWYDAANFAADWEELTPWNVHRVDLSGNLEKLTNSTDSGWGVVLASADGNSILFGSIDWIVNTSNHVVGGSHRLILMDTDGTSQRQLIPDDIHTGTLEYFDW